MKHVYNDVSTSENSFNTLRRFIKLINFVQVSVVTQRAYKFAVSIENFLESY